MFGDSFFKKVENKTKVDKNTIMSLASKIQNSDMKDEKVIRDLIGEISTLTGKEVSEEKKKKIVEAVVNDKVPKDLNKYVEDQTKSN